MEVAVSVPALHLRSKLEELGCVCDSVNSFFCAPWHISFYSTKLKEMRLVKFLACVFPLFKIFTCSTEIHLNIAI